MVSPSLLLFIESLGVVLVSNIGTTSDASDVYNDGLRLRIFALYYRLRALERLIPD